MTVSKKQLIANRQNAQKSTGPKTQSGKNAVRLNALKHGLYAKDVVLDSKKYSEVPDDYNLLLATISQELQPVGLLEESLVYKMVNSLWRSRRALRAESAQIVHGAENPENEDFADRFFEMIDNIRDPKNEKPLTRQKMADIVQLLKKCRAFLQNHGHLTGDQTGLLFEFFPLTDETPARLNNMNYEQIENGDLADDEILPNVLENPENVERRDEMVKLIDSEIARFTAMHQQAPIDTDESVIEQTEPDPKDSPDSEIIAGLKAIPDNQASFNILRYEMRLDKQFSRALNQLLKLQDRREKRSGGMEL